MILFIYKSSLDDYLNSHIKDIYKLNTRLNNTCTLKILVLMPKI